MTAIEIIRLVGTEFAETTDETLEKWVEVVKPLVSKKQFGKLYEQALAYLVCHKMKMAGIGTSPLGEQFGNINAFGFAFSSVSEGGSSISFGASQNSNLTKDAEYGLTSYGMQYLNLRRLVVVPIRISGEDMI